jgi:hypothetical protein
MSISELKVARWRKSSHSAFDNDDCVDVAVGNSVVGVRDTKDRDGLTLIFSCMTWSTFLAAIKHGEHGTRPAH